MLSNKVIWDIYGPLARWIFKPAASVQKEISDYRAEKMSAEVSVCLQGRWGLQKELDQGKICASEAFSASKRPRNRPVLGRGRCRLAWK